MDKGVNQLGGILAMLVTPSLFAFELAGQLNVEHRQFLSQGLQGQSKGQSSVVVQPELYWDFQSGESSFTFTPFFESIASMMKEPTVTLEKRFFSRIGMITSLELGSVKCFGASPSPRIWLML